MFDPPHSFTLSLHCPRCNWTGEALAFVDDLNIPYPCPNCGARLSVLRRSLAQLEADAANRAKLRDDSPQGAEALQMMIRALWLNEHFWLEVNLRQTFNEIDRPHLLPIAQAVIAADWIMLHAN